MTGEENEAVWLEALDYQDILNSAPDAMVLVDAQGVIGLINKQTEKIFGYARDKLSGEPIEILVPADYSGHHEHPAVQEHQAAVSELVRQVEEYDFDTALKTLRQLMQQFIADSYG